MARNVANGNTLSGGRRVRAGVRPLFSSWLYQSDDGPVHLNRRLARLAHRLMEDPRGATVRTNRGGWHYAFDLFELSLPVIDEFRAEIREHVQGFLNQFRAPERQREDRFRLRGWLNVNRAGDSNSLHSHPGSFVSAVYYVKVPQRMQGGAIAFRDPRGPAIAMYETPKIELPWVAGGPSFAIRPKEGQLLLFPSWLEHEVEPFRGRGERISLAFNAENA
jgi:uncharacterized protein (TIGR02466 family)